MISSLNAQVVFEVNNSADTGGAIDKTLRNAINQVNMGNVDQIVFDLPPGDTEIQLLSELPVITQPVFIDGKNSDGSLVVLNALNIPTTYDKGVLSISYTDPSETCDIRNFVINNFPANTESIGIFFENSGVNASLSKITDNYIGLTPSGTLIGQPSLVGIFATGSALIRGNNVVNWVKYGVYVANNKTRVLDNAIGVGPTGNYLGENTGPGLYVTLSNEIRGNRIVSAENSSSVLSVTSNSFFSNVIGYEKGDPRVNTHLAIEHTGTGVLTLGDQADVNKNTIGGKIRAQNLSNWVVNNYLEDISILGSEFIPAPSNIFYNVSNRTISGNATANNDVLVFLDDDGVGAELFLLKLTANASGIWELTLTESELANFISSGTTFIRAIEVRAQSSLLSINTTESRLRDCEPFVVNKNTDSNPSVCGEMRYAIEQANLDPLKNEITFSFTSPLASPYIINLTRSLPKISRPVVINGWSATGVKSKPGVQISGQNNSSLAGLFLDPNCDQSEVYGLAFTNFTGLDNYGLTVGADECKIYGNYFGLDLNGQSASNYNGLVVFGDKNTIGFNNDGVDDSFERNIFSSNNANGLFLKNVPSPVSVSSNNRVAGNYFGLGPDGTTILTNNIAGIGLNLSQNNVIGGNAVADRNYFALNDGFHGVFFGGGANRNQVIGNWIGFDVNGNSAKGTNSNAIRIGNANSGNSVGDDSDLMSANRLNGKILVSNTTELTEDNKWGINNYLDIIDFIPATGQVVQNNVMPPTNLQSSNRTVSMEVEPGAKVFIFASSANNAEEFIHVMDETMGSTTFVYEIPLARANELVINGFTKITAIQSVRSPTTSNFNSSELATHVDLDFCATPLIVTKTTDDGTCGTLRRAVETVNADPSNLEISFAISGADKTIILERTLELSQDDVVIKGGSSGVKIVPNTGFIDANNLSAEKKLINHNNALNVRWENIFFENASMESIVAMTASGSSAFDAINCDFKDFKVGFSVLDDSFIRILNGTEIYSSLTGFGQVDGLRINTSLGLVMESSFIPYMPGNGITIINADAVRIERNEFGGDTPRGVSAGTVNEAIVAGVTPGQVNSLDLSDNIFSNIAFKNIFLLNVGSSRIERNTLSAGVDGIFCDPVSTQVLMSENIISGQSNLPITNPTANAYIPIITDIDDLSGGGYYVAGDLPNSFEPNGGLLFPFRIELFGTNSNQAEVYITGSDFNSVGDWDFNSLNLDLGSYSHLTATATYLNNTSPLSSETEIAPCKYIANAGTDQTICENENVISLLATISGGSTNGQWSVDETVYSGNFDTDSGLENIYSLSSLDKEKDSVYFVFTPEAFPDNTCEVVPDTLSVFFIAAEEFNILDVSPVCAQNYFLTTDVGGEVNWFRDAISPVPLLSEDTAQFAEAGIYLATYTSNGCLSSATIEVTYPFYNLPSVSISSPSGSSLCVPEVSLFSTGAPTDYNITWFNNDTQIQVGTGTNYLPNSPGNYYFVADSTEDCKVTSELIFVSPCVPIVKDSMFNQITNNTFVIDVSELVIQNGVEVDLNSITFSNPVGANNWFNNSGLIEYGPTSGFTGLVSIDYTIKDINGVESEIKTLSINYSDDPCAVFDSGINVSTNSDICTGEVLLTAPLVSGVNYAWSYQNNLNKIAGASTNSYNALLEGKYFVVYNGICSGQLEVDVLYGNQINVFKSGNVLEGEATGASYYQWYAVLPEGNRAIVGANNIDYTAFFDGGYFLQVSFNSNCILNSNTISVTTTGRGELFKAGLVQTENLIYIPETLESSVSVFPNPSDGSGLKVRFVSYSEEVITLTITDLMGAIVAQENLAHLTGESTLELTRYDLEAGVYVLMIGQNGKSFQERIIIE